MSHAQRDPAIDVTRFLAVAEELALRAGKAIMTVRFKGIEAATKADLSPVTQADLEAERIIVGGLREHFPDIGCVAEEEMSQGHDPGACNNSFFLVDPLDGTKEFVNGRDDFTVNIALISDGAPVAGVVYAPARHLLYVGGPDGAQEIATGPDHLALSRRKLVVRARAVPPAILASRSHQTPETQAYLERYPDALIVSAGSSLKFCMLAAGQADIYPRFGPTMQWDTAAGDAVLRAAGGRMRTADGKPLIYGPRRGGGGLAFENPHFICEGAES